MDDGQTESATTKVNAVEPPGQGRRRTMEHLNLLRADHADSFTPSHHGKKSFQSTLSKYTQYTESGIKTRLVSDSDHFSSAWDLGGIQKRSSNSLRRLNFEHRLSSSELCLDSVGGERTLIADNFRSVLRPTDSIDSDASSSSTFPERVTSFDLSSLDSFMDLNSDDFTSHKSEGHIASPITNVEDLDNSKDSSGERRKKDQGQLFQAIKRFNLHPDKGLKLLEERGFIEMTPKSIAHFLFNQERLSKKQIGVVIGGHKELNKSVLQNFVRLHQFQKVNLVDALRKFLWSFR